MVKKHKKKKSRSISTDTANLAKSKVIRVRMTKAQLTAYLVNYVENQEEDITSAITSRNMKKLITATMDGLTDAIQKSICPGSDGEFMMPRMFKITLKNKKAIKKGTMVRSPATGGMVPSKGRPASKRVKIRALVNLKKAAAGEI